MSDVLYRYEDHRYATLSDEYGGSSPYVRIELRTFEVIRRTPKGVWINLFGNLAPLDKSSQRFVLLKATKRFACETIEEAQASFRARKQRQIRIYRARMHAAEQALREFEWSKREGVAA